MLCSEWVFSFVAALFIYNEHVFIYMFLSTNLRYIFIPSNCFNTFSECLWKCCKMERHHKMEGWYLGLVLCQYL